MRANVYRKLLLAFSMATGSLLLSAGCVYGQSTPANDAAGGTPSAVTPLDQTADMRALVQSVRALQAQVQALTLQVSELRAEQQRARAQPADVRHERVQGENLSSKINIKGPFATASGTEAGYFTPAVNSGQAEASGQQTPSGQQNLSRIARRIAARRQ